MGWKGRKAGVKVRPLGSGSQPAWLICRLLQGQEEMKRQTEHSPQEAAMSCRKGKPHPPSRSGTTGSRSSRSRPPGRAAWCSPSAGIGVPAGSETRPGEGGGSAQCPDRLALYPQQGPGSGSHLHLPLRAVQRCVTNPCRVEEGTTPAATRTISTRKNTLCNSALHTSHKLANSSFRSETSQGQW